MLEKGDDCPKCKSGELKKEGLPSGYWLECDNCGSIPTVK